MAPVHLTVEDIYPSDDDPSPVRIHLNQLDQLDVRPSEEVRLTADDGTTVTFECQRNDYIPHEEGLIRISPTVREELGVSIGDIVEVSPVSECI